LNQEKELERKTHTHTHTHKPPKQSHTCTTTYTPYKIEKRLGPDEKAIDAVVLPIYYLCAQLKFLVVHTKNIT